MAWVVDIVTIGCTAPSSKLTFELVPEGLLMAESQPAGTLPSAPMDFGLPPTTFGTFELQVDRQKVVFRFAGRQVTLVVPWDYTMSSGCTVTVGAVPTGNAPPTVTQIGTLCTTGF